MRKLLAAILLSGFALPAFAVGTFVPASSRIDVAHDDSRGLVYISNGNQILRYHPASGTFLSPVTLSGSLGGIDISPDNKTLVVAEMGGSTAQSWVYLVDLDTLAYQTKAVNTPDTMEGGTYTAVYGANEQIYTTSTFNGSGWVELRRLNPTTGAWTDLASVRQSTMLSASGDAKTIAFAEANISDGAWGMIDVPTGAIVRREGYTNGTSWFNFEIGTDRFGAQFSLPTYGGNMVYDDAYQKIGTIGTYAGQLPIGVAYHPVERIAYFPFAQTSEVRVYNMDTQTQSGAFNFEYAFPWTGNGAFNSGRTKLSRDGSLLMVTVGGGVRIYQQYTSLQADAASATTNAGQATTITLPGSIGNGGALTYYVGFPAAHGTVSINGNVATYTPAAGFSGSDFFTYLVGYGRAMRSATVSLTVTPPPPPPNVAPVAVNDVAATRNTAIQIPVLANDTDADGDALSIVSVTVPNAGSAAIQGTKVLFTPPKSLPKTGVSFNYTISDGHGHTATAKVSVSRN
jgi:hypothetical protein